MREGICDAVKLAQGDGTKAIVVVCEGRTFIAGADINEFGKPMQEPTLPQVNAALESLTKPVIAAIHGTALGAGLSWL